MTIRSSDTASKRELYYVVEICVPLQIPGKTVNYCPLQNDVLVSFLERFSQSLKIMLLLLLLIIIVIATTY